MTCLVERTAWELADFRDDIYIPLCYDAVGSKTYLQAIMDTATLRSQGMSPVVLKAEVESRYQNKIYRVPEKSGGFNGFAVHLANHDVTLSAVSRASLAKVQAYKRRMGGRFPGRPRSAASST